MKSFRPFSSLFALSTALLGILIVPLPVRVSSENVLVLLPLASKSHKNVFEPLVNALADRGHQVTLVSPYEPSKQKKNIRELVPSNFSVVMASQFGNPFERKAQSKMTVITSVVKYMVDGCDSVYANQEFLDLLKQKFDLVLLDAFLNDCMAGFIHKLGAPFILVSPTGAPATITQHVGNRLPPSFVPYMLLAFSDQMTFVQRIINLSVSSLMHLLGSWLMEPQLEAAYRQHLGQDIPIIPEVYKNVAFIFMNSHVTINHPRPTLPDEVEVGGMQCGPAKPLPKDLKQFMDGAKDGVIFFSLGSIIQGTQLPDHVRKIFLNVFSRLKERVLWKWETEVMPDLPKNVKLGKWLPQQDILGHPNTKLFITHGGLLSTQEATYHGIPLVGIPIMGDQDLNAKQAERSGYSLTINILEITEEILEKTINEILTNPSYTQRAKELSELFRDQSETPLERAVFWSEYVMRHKGAPHLRSAARKLNFFQYYSLDVIGAMGAILLIVLIILKFVIVKIARVVLSLFGFGKEKKNDASSRSQTKKIQ